MTANLEAFQALLADMREAFLSELSERCDGFDKAILTLEKSPGDREAFTECYRGVHSLKGLGGTHGIPFITTVCHQLESLLTATDAERGFGPAFATRALAYVDLLRRIEPLARQQQPNYSLLESELEALRRLMLARRKAGLIVESSAMMAGLYLEALKDMPLQLTVLDNGLAALELLLHQPFDFVIVGRELKELNGLALMLAVRTARARNKDIPAILISSTRDGIPSQAGFVATLARDQHLIDNVVASVRALLPD